MEILWVTVEFKPSKMKLALVLFLQMASFDENDFNPAKSKFCSTLFRNLFRMGTVILSQRDLLLDGQAWFALNGR